MKCVRIVEVIGKNFRVRTVAGFPVCASKMWIIDTWRNKCDYSWIFLLEHDSSTRLLEKLGSLFKDTGVGSWPVGMEVQVVQQFKKFIKLKAVPHFVENLWYTW